MSKRSLRAVLLAVPLLAATAVTGTAADSRQPVTLPKPMQDHMLANMRDHLMALEAILAALADGDAETAAEVAENRLGMSSLDDHGAAHMAPLMPEEMQAIGTAMHRAASRFALTAEDAAVTQTPEAQREVFGALQAITAQCNACHQSFRLR